MTTNSFRVLGCAILKFVALMSIIAVGMWLYLMLPGLVHAAVGALIGLALLVLLFMIVWDSCKQSGIK